MSIHFSLFKKYKSLPVVGVVKVLDNIADIGMLEGVEISCTEQIEERIRVACHSENILDPPNVIVEIL